MHKLPDWETRLSAVVTQALPRPFEWGVNDCCLWAADCVQAQTGADPAADLRGTYSDARGALALVQRLGGMRAIGDMTGSPIPALMATHGDIGLVRHEDHDLLALCNCTHWLAVGPYGLVVLPLTLAVHAWRVGHG